ERVGDHDLGAGADVVLVHLAHELAVAEHGERRPDGAVHRHPARLELGAGAAVEQHHLAGGEAPPQGVAGHAAWPPSTSSAAPVMYDASSEARNSAGATTSPISARRCSGVASRIAPRIGWLASMRAVRSVST